MLLPSSIVFCGDFLRPDAAGEPHQRDNARWLRHVLAGLAAQFDDVRVIDSHLAGTPLRELYLRAYAGDPVAGWAQLRTADAFPPWIEDAVAAATHDALVVIFEASPALRASFDRLGRPWIDVRVDPRRFLPDLLLDFRCSDAALQARIARSALDPELLAAEIAYVRARHFHCDPELPDDALVVLAQVALDASLSHAGGIATPGDFAAEIAAMAAGRRALLAPHPYDDGNSLAAWRALLPDARVLDTNFYRMIAVEPPVAMLTLSSGSEVEASLFGHRVTRLLPPPPPAGAALLHAYWYPGFWRWAMGKAEVPPALPPFVPDRLRRVINQHWSKQF